MSLHPAFLAAPIAHRGLHDLTAGRPENGLSAVRAAVDAGYGLELDVQISSDGIAMVFHDYELDRVTDERGQVKRRSAEALGQIRLADSEDRIPRLSEVLGLVAGRVPILLEIKEQSRFMGPVDGVLEHAVASELRGYDGPVAVMSFNPASVAALSEAAPEVPRGLTSGSYGHPEWAPLGDAILDGFRALEGFDRTGCSFISHFHQDLSDPVIAKMKTRGVPVLCWTVSTPETEAAARQIADNVTFEGYLP